MTSAAALTLPIDLSRLPPLQLVAVDYEAELARLKAGVTERMRAWGFDLDATTLESEPLVALMEEVAFRRVLALQELNDAGKRMTLAHAYGPALDHIAATYYADVGVRRLEDEQDDRFLKRVLLAAHARSPGTLEGYEYWAMTFAPLLSDARALNYASGLVPKGDVAIVLLANAGVSLEDEAGQVAQARAGLTARSIAQASDRLVVRAATRVALNVSATLALGPGPDSALVLAEARKSLLNYGVERRRVGKKVTLSGLHAALTVGGVEGVRLLNPVADVDPGSDGVVEFGVLTLQLEPN